MLPKLPNPLSNPDLTDKQTEEILTAMYQEAVEIEMGLAPHTIHPTKFRYGASDSTCPRLAYLKCHLHALVPEFDVSTTRKFRVGDIFHKMADDGIDKVLWKFGGDIVRVSSFQLRCFEDMFEGLVPGFVGGTPDHILISPKKKHLYLVDQKSANDYGFRSNKRTGSSIYHGIQVGTYFDGLMNSPLHDYVDSGAMFVCYMSKESVEVAVRKVPGTMVRDAKAYWQLVANADKAHTLPPALPREDWACKYCPFFKQEADPLGACSGMESLNDVRKFMGAEEEVPLADDQSEGSAG